MRRGKIAHHDRIFPRHEVVAVNPSQPSLSLPRRDVRRFTREKGIDGLDEFGLIRRIETDEAIGRDRKDNDRTDDNRDNVTETDAH